MTLTDRRCYNCAQVLDDSDDDLCSGCEDALLHYEPALRKACEARDLERAEQLIRQHFNEGQQKELARRLHWGPRN